MTQILMYVSLQPVHGAVHHLRLACYGAKKKKKKNFLAEILSVTGGAHCMDIANQTDTWSALFS